jgi:hypothetical protein
MADASSPADSKTTEPIETSSAHESAAPDVTASPSEAKGETKETLLEAVMKAVKPSDDGEEEKPSG